jgi:hypothetical protein
VTPKVLKYIPRGWVVTIFCIKETCSEVTAEPALTVADFEYRDHTEKKSN